MKILIALVVLVSLADPAAAQRRDTSGWHRSATVPTLEAARPSASERIGRRALNGLVGTVVGGVAGATIGYQATYRGASGEDPGADGLLVGAIMGGAVGATVGAALPKHGTRCTLRDRLTRGLLGAGAVAAAFLTTTYAFDGTEAVIAFPVAAPLAAAVAADC